MLKRNLAIVCGISFYLFCTFQSFAQQSTSGPKPHPEMSKGEINKSGENIVEINGIPSYIFHHGCGPTAAGMVIGYYDSNGFPDLIPGDAQAQTTAVNDAIANTDHYNDYSLPLDYYPNLIPDLSELGGAHTPNCLGDFMKTSWSSEVNYYEWSWFWDVDDAFNGYVQYINSNYNVTTSNINYSSSTWNIYKNEIDNNRPVLLLVDRYGIGDSDHFVTGVGYDDATNEYGIYNTYDHVIHYHPWQEIAVGNEYGIYGINLFDIESLPNITVTPDSYDFGFILMNDCSEDVPFIISNTGGSVANGSYDLGNWLNYSMSSPPSSFSLNPGESLTVFISFCPVTYEGFGNNLNISGNFDPVNVSLTGSSYCLEIITEANPLDGGTTSPLSEIVGEDWVQVCFDANPNPGFEFVNWEHNGNGISQDPHYCNSIWDCSLDPYILTANFQPIGLPFITVSPISYDFGSVLVGECSNPHTFEILNEGGVLAEGSIPWPFPPPLDVFELTSTSTGTLDFSLQPGESFYFDVEFCPFENYNYSGDLVINGVDPCNDVLLHLEGEGYTYITVSTFADPPEGGTTTGDDEYLQGTEACVNAIPNPGFEFDHWEEMCSFGGGYPNSSDPEHCFNVGYDYYGEICWIAIFTPTIELNLELFLEGPFNGNDMNTELVNLPDFPLSQPYNVPPWNYNGDESVTSIPNQDIVDWILVEIRDAPGDASTATESTKVASKAAFLLNNGNVVDMDGFSPFSIPTEVSNNLFVVIWHRNHLGIMSSNPLFNTDGYYYDFSIGENLVYGGNLGHKEIGPGVWGMVGGDYDASGVIDDNDKINGWEIDAGYSGYLNSDFNLNGEVENIDKNDVWWPNRDYVSQVPNGDTFNCGEPFIDSRDGQSYNTVQIGNQCWMKENLNIGDMLVLQDEQYPSNNGTIEKYCFDDNSSYCDEYGGLYIWDELMEYSYIQGTQGICPEGWYIPDDEEWDILINSFGGFDLAGGKLKEAGYIHWESPNTGADNESEFTGFGAGHADYSLYLALKHKAFFWSSSHLGSPETGPYYILSHNNDDVFYVGGSEDDLAQSARCIKDSPPATWSCGDPVIDDRDSQSYNTVEIGNQCWMKENLNIGDVLVLQGEQYPSNNGTIEKYCFDDNSSYCDEYGGLYIWDELMEYSYIQGTQGICPDGWHIPDDNEWDILVNGQGGLDEAGGNLKEAGYIHWESPNTGADNESGFTGLGAGRTDYSFFLGLEYKAYFWSSSHLGSPETGPYYILSHDNDDVFYIGGSDDDLAQSARCIKDSSPPTWSCGDPIIDDRDSQTYNTVEIGNQCWMAESLNVGDMIDGNVTPSPGNGIEKYCYDNSETNCDSYGALYNWDEMMDWTTTEEAQGICPDGWHIPSNTEWCTMENFVEGGSIGCDETGWRGSIVGHHLRSTSGWNASGNGDDLFGFAGIAGGNRHWELQTFNYLTMFGYHWTSTEWIDEKATYRTLSFEQNGVYRGNVKQTYGFSLRCIKD